MSASETARALGGAHTVRRIVVYLLLFTMVVIAAIGVAGLLDRLVGIGSVQLANPPGNGLSDLAQSLAFALIAGPLAAALWWMTWRGLTTNGDRASIAWPLYLTLMMTISLVTFTIGLLAWFGALISGDAQSSALAVGITWALVWVWHWWMWHHTLKGPTRLIGVAPALASLIGLTLGVAGAISALMGLLSEALDSLDAVTFGWPWWQQVVQSLIWMVGGGLVWWWHWIHEQVWMLRTGFSHVLLVLITEFASLSLAVFGIASTVYVVLRVLFDRSEPLPAIISPLDQYLAMALVGALVLVYHRGIVSIHSESVRQATRLVTSGVCLAVAASGIGVIVNSVLALIATPPGGSEVRSLSLGGISALVVGGLVWWAAWRPRTAGKAAGVPTPGRRIYLVVVFGVSGVVALLTLLVIGYQLFSFALESAVFPSLLDRMRQSLGLLSATVLVAVYHFQLWRRDRLSTGEDSARRIEQIILVVAPGHDELGPALREATGARVTVWNRSIDEEVERNVVTIDGADDGLNEVTVTAVTAALGEITANRVLLIARPKRVEVIVLED